MNNKSKKSLFYFATTAFILLLLIIAVCKYIDYSKYPMGNTMMQTIKIQMDFGPRYFGSIGHAKMREYIEKELHSYGLNVQDQVWSDPDGANYKNIIARTNPDSKERIILGAHYDSKQIANRDKPNLGLPVTGANDSASGTAVLLALADQISQRPDIKQGVDFVFFDAEEYKPVNFDNWNPKGSTYFASKKPELYSEASPELAIIVDMVCEKGVRLEKEKRSAESAPEQTNKLWEIGQSIDSASFSNQIRSEVKDDHTPLANSGIPSLVMIDLNYPYFHTSQDTLDKCSAKSLESVYNTLLKYIENY